MKLIKWYACDVALAVIPVVGLFLSLPKNDWIVGIMFSLMSGFYMGLVGMTQPFSSYGRRL